MLDSETGTRPKPRTLAIERGSGRLVLLDASPTTVGYNLTIECPDPELQPDVVSAFGTIWAEHWGATLPQVARPAFLETDEGECYLIELVPASEMQSERLPFRLKSDLTGRLSRDVSSAHAPKAKPYLASSF